MKTKQIKAELVRSATHELLDRWELPADAASYERMVEQMARAQWRRLRVRPCATWRFAAECVRDAYRRDTRAALRAIGITAPKKGNK